MSDSPDERLHKLAKEFHRFVSGDSAIENKQTANKQTAQEIALYFGLSLSQAESWLKKEPNYIADDILQRKEDRRGLDRTVFGAFYKGRGV